MKRHEAMPFEAMRDTYIHRKNFEKWHSTKIGSHERISRYTHVHACTTQLYQGLIQGVQGHSPQGFLFPPSPTPPSIVILVHTKVHVNDGIWVDRTAQ